MDKLPSPPGFQSKWQLAKELRLTQERATCSLEEHPPPRDPAQRRPALHSLVTARCRQLSAPHARKPQLQSGAGSQPGPGRELIHVAGAPSSLRELGRLLLTSSWVTDLLCSRRGPSRPRCGDDGNVFWPVGLLCGACGGRKQLDSSFHRCAQTELGVNFRPGQITLQSACSPNAGSAPHPHVQVSKQRGRAPGSCAKHQLPSTGRHQQSGSPPQLAFLQSEQKPAGTASLSEEQHWSMQPAAPAHTNPPFGARTSLHAASWEPCTPEANSAPSTRPSAHAALLHSSFPPNSWKSDSEQPRCWVSFK